MTAKPADTTEAALVPAIEALDKAREALAAASPRVRDAIRALKAALEECEAALTGPSPYSVAAGIRPGLGKGVSGAMP